MISGRKRKASTTKASNIAAIDDTTLPKKVKKAGIPGRKNKKKRDEDDDPEDDEHISQAPDDYDLSEFQYLRDALHYDPEDRGVFKCVDIVAEDFGEGAQVVVYRSKYLEKSKKWGRVDTTPIHVSDVIKYHKHPKNTINVNAVINPKGMKR